MDPENPTQEEGQQDEILTPSFPMGRVKKIVKIDQEIKKLNSEALYLISLSADLFLASLAEGARDAAINKKRKIIKLDHIRSAVRAHAPTSDFLLDCLPNPAQPPPPPLPPGSRCLPGPAGSTISSGSLRKLQSDADVRMGAGC